MKKHREDQPIKEYDNVWGKNKQLEKFWHKLASGDNVILIYKNGTDKQLALPNGKKSRENKYKEFAEDVDIKAVLSSNPSSDAYEYLYKRAKNKAPSEVIKNYSKYFYFYNPEDQIMKKVMLPRT